MKLTKSAIFKLAHKMIKSAIEKWGGSYKTYSSFALGEVYSAIKLTNLTECQEMNESQLLDHIEYLISLNLETKLVLKVSSELEIKHKNLGKVYLKQGKKYVNFFPAKLDQFIQLINSIVHSQAEEERSDFRKNLNLEIKELNLDAKILFLTTNFNSQKHLF